MKITVAPPVDGLRVNFLFVRVWLEFVLAVLVRSPPPPQNANRAGVRFGLGAVQSDQQFISA